ncbi:ABC-type amino acid transport system permease subunit/anti-sigma regulatory factor (Ser/Thr protein kinase) [Kaistia hirudinis]|uniref:ABC-type amino acid transport system permease subunit/anti-sigma regulatory factor (Ser/Thr protein kinase) n=1 Tax=Kaistia hirudinis TaxID=1293440 RepID=A0A840AW44_9HYPH|nr:ATP-binding protein [Kaistia hirudinis]MBB3933011.1 ABC-type amino acid transport system permease subunit/anti-sigma regulatory factor (Ser/Thr protein kinase) [Kaistia hirudinis]
MTRDTFAALLAWTPFLAGGFLWNIVISLATMAIGTPAGYLLARGRLNGSRVAGFLTAAARVPPTFVLIYYLAYLLPPEIVLGPLALPLPGWVKASLALAVAVTGFVSDNALQALRHLKRGERVEALYFVPAWTTYFLIIVMASSTASVIGVPEIVQRANTVIAAIGDSGAILAVYLYVMAFFLVFCWPLARLLGYARVRLGRRAGSEVGVRVSPESPAGTEAVLATSSRGDAGVDPDATPDDSFELPVAPASVAAIQSRVETVCGERLDPAALFRLSLAVEELVTNVVKYGHAGGEPIRVAVRHDDSRVTVDLAYGGPQFDPFRDAPKPDLTADIDERHIGGLGIHLVANMIDEAVYHHSGGTNAIRLVMLRPGAHAGATAS